MTTFTLPNVILSQSEESEALRGDFLAKAPHVEERPLHRIASVVEYQGTRYHGFQYQRNASTIQEEIEKAVLKLTGERVRVKAAGRTDSGVHSKGQVVAFNTRSDHSPITFQKALNYYLPPDIAIREAFQVPANFDPRRHALSREYHYFMLNSRAPSPLLREWAYWLNRPLDVELMDSAARLLEGSHNFSKLCAQGKQRSLVRRVNQARVVRDGDLVVFQIEANAFLPHQVRRTTGALLQVGLGSRSLEEFASLVEGVPDTRGFPTLPPHGLYLIRVNYNHRPQNMAPSKASTASLLASSIVGNHENVLSKA